MQSNSNISTALGFMAIQTAIFILTWTAIHRHVSLHGPFPLAARINRIHNRLYSTLNILLVLLILLSREGTSHDLLARRIYHLSKFYEYTDVLAVRASGGIINLHFAIHHLTTPYLTLVRVLHNSEGWKIGAAFNVFHHVIMYAYFGGVSTLRGLLPWTGTAQLVGGLLVEVMVVREKMERKSGRVWPNFVAGGLGCVYFCLWVRELVQMRDEGRREKEAKGS